MENIKILQQASNNESTEFGLKIENRLLVGTAEWFEAIEKGLIELKTLKGKIAKVFMSGHNDWPECKVESDEGLSNWTRLGTDEYYVEGKRIEIDFVFQKFNKPVPVLGETTKRVIQIRIEE